MSSLSNLASNPSLTLFYLLLLSIPSQLGRHFWPSSAFVNGLRVDYLSPTFYFSDIIVLLLFVEMLPRLILRTSKVKILIIGIIVASLAYFSYSSPFSENSLFGVIRLVEMIFVTWVVSYFLSAKGRQQGTSFILSVSLLLVGILASWQFIIQRSAGGLWYYLGERTFSTLTPGIANTSLNGNLVLRPYAAFPHPNVLAAFCVIMVTYLLLSFQKQIKWLNILKMLAIVLGITTVLLSLSRSGIAVLLIILFIWFICMIRKKRQALGVGIIISGLIGIIIFISGAYLRFAQLQFSDEAVVIREFLLSKAYVMFLNHPWTGVGIQNFLPTLANQISPLAPLSYFQPVHSVYFLVLSETGIFGAVLALLGLGYLFYRIIRASDQRLLKSALLVVVLLLSLTDHYFYTLHQGQLLLAFALGVILAQPVPFFTRLEAKNPRTRSQSRKSKKSLPPQPLKNSRTGTSRRGKKKK